MHGSEPKKGGIDIFKRFKPKPGGRWEAFYAHPGCPALISALGLWAGLYASVWTAEIGSAWPFIEIRHYTLKWITDFSTWTWSFKATAFHLIALSSAGLFFFRTWVLDGRREVARQEMIDEAKRLTGALAQLGSQTTELKTAQDGLNQQTAELKKQTDYLQLQSAAVEFETAILQYKTGEMDEKTTNLQKQSKLLLLEQNKFETVQSEMMKDAKKLAEAVMTIPPENFLDTFSMHYQDILALERASLKPPALQSDDTIITHSIRVILRVIGKLASSFDGSHADVRYAVNVMLYKSTTSLIASNKLKEIRPFLINEDENTPLETFKGFLDLDMELSAVATARRGKTDNKLKRIVLAIPNKGTINRSGDKLYTVTPGASVAFIDGQITENILYNNTKDMRAWCRKNSPLGEDMIARMEDFYRKNKRYLRSFASIPLFCEYQYEANGENLDEPIAILNIHCNRNILLKDGSYRALAQFTAIAQPIIATLGTFVKLYAIQKETSDKSYVGGIEQDDPETSRKL